VGTDRRAVGRTDRVFVRALLLVLLVIAAAVIVPLTPLARWLEVPHEAADWIRGFGASGVVLFFAGMVALILVGVPRLLFCPVGGALFGFWGGLAYSIASSLAAYYLVFLFVRGRASPPQIRFEGKLAFLRADPGLAGVILARLVPLPGLLPTLALATSGVGHAGYLVGSAIGLAPEAAPLVLLGTGGLHADAAHIARIVVAALACVTVTWLLARHVARRLPASADGVEG